MDKRESLKMYIGTWYNYLAQGSTSDVMWAHSKKEAAVILLAIMKLFGGDKYNESYIEEIREVTPNSCGYSMEKIKERYDESNKEWIFDNYELSKECAYADDEDDQE